MTMYGQGRVAFNNATYSAPDAITVDALNQGAAGGNTGDGIGNDKYAVQLLFAAGSFASQAAFDAANPTASSVFTGVFLVNTGPLATFSGFFDAGQIATATAGTYTMQCLAWYNVGFSTFAAASAGGVNVGKSALFTINSTASPSPINSTVFPGFTVAALVPEPSTFALAGLGAAALLLFRRRK